MKRPPAADARRVIEYIRRHRSATYRQVPDDFLGWRLGLRRQARLHGMRVSVRRGALGWVVENPDWGIFPAERAAGFDVLYESDTDPDVDVDVDVDQIAPRRRRLRLVTPDQPDAPETST